MSEYATIDEVQAWDTEYGDYVIWGTHSPAAARAAVRKYICEVIEEDPDQLTPPFEEFENGKRKWADPECLENDGIWDQSKIADHTEDYVPYDGWVPYMFLAL